MTTATQLNIVLPNVPGSLAKLCDLLRSAEVNIEAISCSNSNDTEDGAASVLHLIVDDIETAKILLRPVGIITTNTLLAFKLKNKPGAIAQVARLCAGGNLNITQIYSTTNGKEAMVYVSVDDTERAIALFGRKGATTMTALVSTR